MSQIKRCTLYGVHAGTGVTILLYIILQHLKRHRVKKFFFQSSVKSRMMTPYKYPNKPPVVYKTIPQKEIFFLHLFAPYLNQSVPTSSVSLRLHRIKEVPAGTSSVPVETIANSRWSQSQFCPKELQIPLRTEIKPLPCATSSRAAFSLQIKLSPYCSNPSYSFCHFICLFAICHYWTEISFKIFLNALEEVSGCYWTVLQIPLF